MRIRLKRERKNPRWEDWFAWRPVIVDKEIVFRETITRRRHYGRSWFDTHWLYMDKIE
jgi:hypothetical protein